MNSAVASPENGDHRRLPGAAGTDISTTTLPTNDGDWAAAICDDCYADLHPDISVTVKFYAARMPRFLPGGGETVAVIRQRDRTDDRMA